VKSFPIRAALVVLISFVVSAAVHDGAYAELKAGAARQSIVPPFPTHMGGFMDRKTTFEGVHDEVFARALVLDNGDTQLVLIGSDLTAVDADMTRQIREAIEKQTGIPASNVLVSCAHNHSAPSIYQPGRQEESKSPVKEFFVEQFTKAALDAYENRRPAKLGFHAGELRGATRNRQQDNDLVDTQVGVVLVQELDSREVIATLFNFTGHPVIVGSKNLHLSGEYPGAACRAVENLLGGIAIFTQGAAGDVTVHRSGDPFAEIERVGRTLAGEVIKSAGFVQGSSDVKLAAKSETLEFSARSFPPLDQAQKALAETQAKLAAAEKSGASRVVLKRISQRMRVHSIGVFVAQARKSGTMEFPDTYAAEVQVFQIGDLILASIPGEIFVEYALELRKRVSQDVEKSTCLVGYANGYIGYIVTPRARQTGGYEASVERVAPEAGRAMIETAVELVHELAVATK